MRVLPKSLFGRLVLVLLAGLVLAQLATAYINLTERDQLLYRAGGMRLAQQIADSEIARFASARRAPQSGRCVTPTSKASIDARRSANRLRQRTIYRAPCRHRAALCIAGCDDRRRAQTGAPAGLTGAQGCPHRKGGPGAFGGGALFVVQVALRDGSWVTFDSQLSPQEAAVPWRVALTLAILLGTVIVLSLIAVRWVTGPLSVLANAAEDLGENINHPPLPENGRPSSRAAGLHRCSSACRFISDRTRS